MVEVIAIECCESSKLGLGSDEDNDAELDHELECCVKDLQFCSIG